MKFQKLISFALTFVMSLFLVLTVSASPPVKTDSASKKSFEKVFKQNAASPVVPVKAESQNNIVSTAQENRNKGAGIELNSVGSHQNIDLNTELYESPPLRCFSGFGFDNNARAKI